MTKKQKREARLLQQQRNIPIEDVSSDILSNELKNELGDENGLVLCGSRAKKKKLKDSKPNPEVVQAVVKMSKAKQKKLQILQERKEKAAKRNKIYDSLQKETVNSHHLNLLHSTSRLGHQQTLRERLKRTFELNKAGVQLDENEIAELTRECQQSEPLPVAAAAVAVAVAVASPKKQQEQSAIPLTPQLKLKKDSVSDEKKDSVSDDKKDNLLDKKKENSNLVSKDMIRQLENLKRKNEEKRQQKLLADKMKENMSCETMNGDIHDSATHDTGIVDRPIYVPSCPTPLDFSGKQPLSAPTLELKKYIERLHRKPEIEAARQLLPVCCAEQEVMELIQDNDIMILCGETGSGKTTQVPQFLYEAGYGSSKSTNPGIIGITQPRRVATVSTAQRVAEEMNLSFGKEGLVGYQIRYDAEHFGNQTRVKFMTDGILLKELQSDFLLKKYSIILLDEAHERNVNTDILIGLLSRIVPMRRKVCQEELNAYNQLSEFEKEKHPQPLSPLKLVVMSATLRVEDFTENQILFPDPPPVLRLDSRQYPVTIHFNKKTVLDDYVLEAYKKVIKIHRKLPEGGILVFLTGKREINQLVRKLRRTFGCHQVQQDAIVEEKNSKTSLSSSSSSSSSSKKEKEEEEEEEIHIRDLDDDEEQADLEDEKQYSNEMLDQSDEEESEKSSEDEDNTLKDAMGKVVVLPLYALLSREDQLRVFSPPPDGHRLIIVATNVAETSVTIPGIKYVVDAGRSKERVYDIQSGISRFDISWVSKASADQRAGRAGRTGPGHCYRLYSSAVYNNEFKQFSDPEILCRPIEDLVLQMKSIGIDHVETFPFPTPPDPKSLEAACTMLQILGAIDINTNKITKLGYVLSKFPIAAQFAKMLLLAKQGNCLPYVIAIVAGLTCPSPFIPPLARKEDEGAMEDDDKLDDDLEKEKKEALAMQRHAQWVHQDSDHLGLLRAIGAYSFLGASSLFCKENYLHEKTMQQILQLRLQLTRISNQMFEKDQNYTPIIVSPKLTPPTPEQEVLIRQIITSGLLNNVARRAPQGLIQSGTKLERNCAYISCSRSVKEPLYIHPHSNVFSGNPASLPSFVVYQHILVTSRAYMKNITVIHESWLPTLAASTPLCKLVGPLESPPPMYNPKLDAIEVYMKPLYGTHQWEFTPIKVQHSIHSTEKDKEDHLYQWFGRLLLEGKIIKEFESFKAFLKESPTGMTRKIPSKRGYLLMAKLKENKIASLQNLKAKWTLDSNFLKEELLPWIRNAKQQDFNNAWKHIIHHSFSSNA